MKVHPMSEANKAIKTRRKYDIQFKRHAVSLWLDGDRSARAVAEELGVRESLLHSWKLKFGPAHKPLSQGDLEAEVAALRRENAQLRQQREVFKKILGILSETPSSVTNGSMR
jgi:transposase